MSTLEILVHDYAGHPFQAQLSRELARRGHRVTHSYCAAYASGKGKLAAGPDDSVLFEPIGVGSEIAKLRFRKRLLQELRFGVDLARQVRRLRPDVVMVANVPIPTLAIFALAMMVFRTRWVLWHQDVQAVAIRSFAGNQLSSSFRVVAAVIEVAERWCAHRAAAVVVIADGFLGVHERWGTANKALVIPNWAPLDEIVPVERHNVWSRSNGVDDQVTILYSGTLGLKHNPALLPALARAVIDGGQPVRLVVVNEGPAVEIVRREAERLDVPLTLLPFQPYEQLSQVLGSGDVLVVLLEKDAGVFSVPSKTLSYLCAGRPVLGLMPAENAAADMIAKVGGCVLPPTVDSLSEGARFIAEAVTDRDHWSSLGRQSREFAEESFALSAVGDRFEGLLAEVAVGGTSKLGG